LRRFRFAEGEMGRGGRAEMLRWILEVPTVGTMAAELPDVGAFGAVFSEFVEAMSAAAHRRESGLATRMRGHLGANPKELPSTSAEFSPTDHPNLQLALAAVLPDAEVIGISAAHPGFMTLGLSALLSGHPMVGAVEPGPVQYTDVEVGDGRIVRCVSTGVFLASHHGVPVVLVLSSSERPFGREALRLEGILPTEGLVSRLLSELRAAMREHNVYRGQVISLPDEAARARLVRLYAQDVPLDEATEQDLVVRTDGLTGAFIKELMRQAGLRAALDDRPPTSDDATAALIELLEERSTLTRRLLGQGADGADAPQPAPAPFPAMLHAFGAAGIPIPDVERE
jgi:hypothetical protein